MKRDKNQCAIYFFLMLCMACSLSVVGLSLYGNPAGNSSLQASAEADAERKYVALTFDDGPNPIYTEKLLDGLKQRKVKASFFLLGEEVEQYPDIVKRMHQEGHLIGTHAYQHVNLNQLTTEAACEQIQKTGDAIFHVTGEYPQYVRPPYGCWKEEVDKRCMMIEVLWDVDTMDWSVQNADRVVQTVERQVKDGSIILMHDAYPSSVEAAFRVIELLQAQHYTFVTIDHIVLE